MSQFQLRYLVKYVCCNIQVIQLMLVLVQQCDMLCDLDMRLLLFPLQIEHGRNRVFVSPRQRFTDWRYTLNMPG